MIGRLRDQRGVTMITVLFVGAALTALTSTAMFVTIQEFRAGNDDKKAAEALAYAEAGIDRMILELRTNSSFGQIRTSGCPGKNLVAVSGTIGGDPKRTYSAELQVWDPNATAPADRLPPASCSVAPHTNPNPRAGPRLLAITSTGEHPTARRIVRQIIEVRPLGLPIGIYADRVDANGSGSTLNISMISETDIVGREKIGFSGSDPYYTKNDFYNNGDTSAIPAAAHSAGLIYYVKGGSTRREHPPSPNCEANPGGAAGQSLWDGSNWTTTASEATVTTGCSGQTGFPPTSLFTPEDLARVAPTPSLSEQDYQTLKEAAKTSGLYCTPSGGGFSCLREGASITTSDVIFQSDLGGLVNRTNFIAFFDYPAGGDPFSAANTFKWKASVQPCNDDPAVNRSMVLIARNGSLSMQNDSFVTGAVLLPEGRFDSQGSYTVHGTLIAEEIRIRGSANLQMSQCWVNNIPGPFVDIFPRTWSEVDR